MSNVSENRMTGAYKSDIDFAKIASDPERVAHNPTNQSFLTKFRRHEQMVQEQRDTLEDTLRSDEEGFPSILEHGTTPAPLSLSKFLNHPQRLSQIRVIAKKEVRRFYALEKKKFFLKAVKDALPDVFQICFDYANDGLNNASFRFVVSLLTHLALKEALEDILDSNIEESAQSSSLPDVFARKALISTHFVRTVAKFICEKFEEQSGKVEEPKR